MARHILLIHTGGTLGMVEGSPDDGLKPAELHESVLKFVPELAQLARLDTAFAFNIDSSNLSIAHINQVCELIRDNYDQYDGFVIIHGTDTMAYHASALSFLIENNHKPIIFTGSQKPLRHIRTDARMNLVNSVEFATLDIPEVCICFNATLFRGNRTRKMSIGRFDAFQSPNYPVLATAGVDLTVHTRFMLAPRGEAPVFHRLKNHRIAVMKVFPGFQPDGFVQCLIQQQVQAVILEAYAAGNVPIQEPSFVPAVRALTENHIPVFVVSQAFEGSVNLGMYECGRRIMEAGAVGCGPMTFESVTAKLQYLLTRYPGVAPAELAIKMQLDLAGEFS